MDLNDSELWVHKLLATSRPRHIQGYTLFKQEFSAVYESARRQRTAKQPTANR